MKVDVDVNVDVDVDVVVDVDESCASKTSIRKAVHVHVYDHVESGLGGRRFLMPESEVIPAGDSWSAPGYHSRALPSMPKPQPPQKALSRQPLWHPHLHVVPLDLKLLFHGNMPIWLKD